MALRKVGAGKATGRACRPKQEQNEVFVTSKMGLQTKTPVSVFVCVCLCVCVRKRREKGRGSKEEGAERTSRKASVHT